MCALVQLDLGPIVCEWCLSVSLVGLALGFALGTELGTLLGRSYKLLRLFRYGVLRLRLSAAGDTTNFSYRCCRNMVVLFKLESVPPPVYTMTPSVG